MTTRATVKLIELESLLATARASDLIPPPTDADYPEGDDHP